MFKWYRLRKAHELYLEYSRNLHEGRCYWNQASGFRRAILQIITPVPLMGLHEDGKLLYEALKDLEASATNEALTLETIKKYHRILSGNDQNSGGALREEKITVKASKVSRPPPPRIGPLLAGLDQRLAQEQARLDEGEHRNPDEVLNTAVMVHQKIAFIHPFQDGNGRVARLAMNHIMRRYGQGYVVLPPLSESKVHFDSLEEAHHGRPETLLAFAKECLYPI